MKRTTIMLPPDLKHRAEHLARKEGVSLAELIRESLETRVSKGRGARDPLFANYAVFSGEAPLDLAEKHDDYLYEE